MRIVELISVFRGAERVLIVGAAIFALYLGYRLFVAGVVNTQSGEISGKSFSIKLFNVGPGIFFALFGVGVLVFMIYTSVTMRIPNNDERGGDETIYLSFYSSQQVSRIEMVIEDIAATKTLLSEGRVSPQSLVPILTSSQRQLARVLLGDEIIEKCQSQVSQNIRSRDCIQYDRLTK
ncbi:MAG: hypothetical protein OXK82_12095 [Deltaproteobacteria bacterium]|nr:hypothetical protein [Deltaproteobacteria bacterium]